MGIPLLLFRQPQKKKSTGVDTSSLLNGLTHYWKMDEVSGTRNDSVGTFHFSTVQGAPGFEAGKIGNAVTFAGATNSLFKPATFMVTSVGATVWGWIKLNVDAIAAIVSIDSSTAKFFLQLNSSNSWQCFVLDSVAGSSTATNTTTSTTGVWHFVCGRYNPSTKKAEIRVDGSGWSLGAALANGPGAVSGNFFINRTGGSYGNCSIDEVGWADRYFTDADVDLLYNGGAGRSYPF